MVKSKLDYEKIPVYNLVVRARDRGFYSKSATSGVKIILQDVDDNPPTFDKVLKILNPDCLQITMNSILIDWTYYVGVVNFFKKNIDLLIIIQFLLG